MWKWVVAFVQIFAVLAMGYGAYQGVRRNLEEGKFSAIAGGLVFGLLMLWACGAILIVVVYGLTTDFEYYVNAFLIGMGVYLVGGLCLCLLWIAPRIFARFPPKRPTQIKLSDASSADGSAEIR
jgi:hypothetical protein